MTRLNRSVVKVLRPLLQGLRTGDDLLQVNSAQAEDVADVDLQSRGSLYRVDGAWTSVSGEMLR